jgi:hypothetical protein
MHNYKVSRNGLWGDRVKPSYPGITKEMIEETVQYVFRDQPERQMVLHTGPRGMEQFRQAVQEELNSDEQLWADIRNEQYPLTPEESFDTGVVTQVGWTTATNPNYLRLQRGEITPVEYLDLISEEE